jgi:hypothetical protein
LPVVLRDFTAQRRKDNKGKELNTSGYSTAKFMLCYLGFLSALETRPQNKRMQHFQAVDCPITLSNKIIKKKLNSIV